MTDFSLAIQGKLQEVVADRRLAVLTALKEATSHSAEQTKLEARRDVARAFGTRLSKTIQDEVYPKRGLAWEPTALVFSKASHIIAPHADGSTIRAKSGAQAVPISGSLATTSRRRRGETLVEMLERRFGDLVPIKRPGKPTLLAVRARAGKGGRLRRVTSRKETKTRGAFTPLDDLTLVPVLTLVNQVRLPKRLDTRQILAKGVRRHPARVAFQLKQTLAASERKTAISA